MKTKDKKNADAHIKKGDKFSKAGKFKKALAEYKKAKDLDPNSAKLYDKLVKTHEKATKEWDAEDIVESVGWVMEKQELENPEIKITHAKLSPEWNLVTEKIQKLICSGTEAEEFKTIEEISAFGDKAIYPLVDAILQIKKGLIGKSKCQTPNE